MDIKPFPIYLLIPGVQVPAPLGGLVLDQRTIGKDRLYLIPISDLPIQRNIWASAGSSYLTWRSLAGN